jgi:hypothetical protein
MKRRAAPRETTPQVKLYEPGRHWHAGKVVYEKHWLRRLF